MERRRGCDLAGGRGLVVTSLDTNLISEGRRTAARGGEAEEDTQVAAFRGLMKEWDWTRLRSQRQQACGGSSCSQLITLM